jgi:phosphoesterase RecJ-like protein
VKFVGLKKIVDIIKDIDNVYIVGHIMPDGDCISSVLCLAEGLKSMGKKVQGFIDWEIPENLRKLPFVNNIKKFKEGIIKPENLIVVDCSSPDRIGRFQKFIRDDVNVIVLDHHATNVYFGNINYVDANASSVAEIVYEINKMLNIKYDEKLATLNLLGILTDTGFFKYSNTTPLILHIAAELMKMGADIQKISLVINENRKVGNLYLQREAINNLKFLSCGKLGYSYLTKKDFEKYKIAENDFDGFVSEIRSVDTVEVAMFAAQYEDKKAHVSLRSKRYFDVSKIALEYGGGGHPKASGFTLVYEKSLEEALESIAKKIGNLL